MRLSEFHRYTKEIGRLPEKKYKGNKGVRRQWKVDKRADAMVRNGEERANDL